MRTTCNRGGRPRLNSSDGSRTLASSRRRRTMVWHPFGVPWRQQRAAGLLPRWHTMAYFSSSPTMWHLPKLRWPPPPGATLPQLWRPPPPDAASPLAAATSTRCGCPSPNHAEAHGWIRRWVQSGVVARSSGSFIFYFFKKCFLCAGAWHTANNMSLSCTWGQAHDEVQPLTSRGGDVPLVPLFRRAPLVHGKIKSSCAPIKCARRRLFVVQPSPCVPVSCVFWPSPCVRGTQRNAVSDSET
jgi:hypothetical protein